MRCRREWKKIEGKAASPQPSLDPLRPLGSSPLKRGQLGATDIAEALSKLMSFRGPDGRYLVTRKVHWQAVYRVLVDEGWYDASLGYAAFVEYIRSVAPPGGFRIMPDVETIRHISQTLYARPFAKWRYDAAYHTKRWAYERMRAVAEALLGVIKN